MQPLKSRAQATSPIEATAIALLRAAEPYQPPTGLKQRVRLRLLGAPVRPRLVVIPALRPALLIGSILFAVGASAAIGAKWMLNERYVASHLPRNTQLQTPPAQAPGTRHSGQTSQESATSTIATPAPLSELQSNSVTRLEDLPLAAGATSAPRRAEATTASGPEATASTEKELVFEAMRALRREGQPERAARLLDEYLRRYPRGSLCEEALALAIEANSALGNPRAKILADRYLSAYPEGRFRPAALRARVRFSQ